VQINPAKAIVSFFILETIVMSYSFENNKKTLRRGISRFLLPVINLIYESIFITMVDSFSFDLFIKKLSIEKAGLK
jgi:hypothetical protein